MSDTAQNTMKVSDDVMITINEMHKWYGDFHVLKNINLSVNHGERIVICGPKPRPRRLR